MDKKENSGHHQPGSKFTVFSPSVSPGLDPKQTNLDLPVQAERAPEKCSISSPRMGQEGPCRAQRGRGLPVCCLPPPPTPQPLRIPLRQVPRTSGREPLSLSRGSVAPTARV